MSALFSGGFGARGGGFYDYTINQSLRSDADGTGYFHRTPSSAGDRRTWTWATWFKRGYSKGNTAFFDIENNVPQPADGDSLVNTTSHGLRWQSYDNLTVRYRLITTGVYIDDASWYHIVLACDTTQATASDRLSMYINGNKVTNFSTETYPALNFEGNMNDSKKHVIANRNYSSAIPFDGYLADTYFIDGQALDPSSFGEFKNSVWVPKAYTGSYGTNGYYFSYSGFNGSTVTDDSPNSNDFTAVNLSTHDIVPDTPTFNYSKINTLHPLTVNPLPTYAQGGLVCQSTVNTTFLAQGSTMAVTSGKWYFEVCNIVGGNNGDAVGFGNSPSDYATIRDTGDRLIDGANVPDTLATWQTAGDIVGVTLDADTGVVQAYVNNVSQGTIHTLDLGKPIHGALYCRAAAANSKLHANFGQDSTFGGTKTRQNNTDDNGYGDFYYAPPSGYLAMCTANIPDPAIGPQASPADNYFNAVRYTGNGGTNSITGVNFQPDLTWIKNRAATDSHVVTDVVRGVGQILSADVSTAELTDSDTITSFDTDGFTLGADVKVNTSSEAYVAWNWKAGNTSGSSNTDGTITSTVTADTKAGFSIVKYTATNVNATVGHGLLSAPEFIIVKKLGDGTAGAVYHKDTTSAGHYLQLFATASAIAAEDLQPPIWNSTDPTSTVFSVGTASRTNPSDLTDLIAYCFHSVEGYSKIGSYEGNGAADGTFVYTGFRPAYLLCKSMDTTSNWFIFDNMREGRNSFNDHLDADTSDVEGSTTMVDFVSNGFKFRITSDPNIAETYVYVAFADHPFKYANAR